VTKDFRDATNDLFAGISHQALADALGVSVATVRQARLAPSAKAHRSPPEGWDEAVASLAEAHASKLLMLAKALDKARAKRDRQRAK